MKTFRVIAITSAISLLCLMAAADDIGIPNSPTTADAQSDAENQAQGVSADTSKQQQELLLKINRALSRGAITADQASQFKSELNEINQKESWHKTYSEAIPDQLLQEDKQHIASLSSKLNRPVPTPSSTSAPVDAIHADIHKSISNALARNAISIQQAEQYYARLAEIEADMESMQNDNVKSTSESATLNESLRRLKAEIASKH
jgi:hypothetical protein